MNKEDAEKYLRLLGRELQKQGVTGEILVHDDIKVLLSVKKPEVHRDIDAYLAGDETAISIPNDMNAYFGGQSEVFHAAIAQIAIDENLSKDWLDVYIVSLDYLLVTKIMASRYKDRQDIQALASRLKIVRRKDVLTLVTKYVASDDISSEVLDEITYLFHV